MALSSGFFNSTSGDRKYSAKDFNQLFEGLVSDGIFQNVGNAMRVRVTANRQIAIGTGRGWFGGIWVNNDADVFMHVPAATSGRIRIDAIVMVVDRTNAQRRAYFTRIAGTEGTTGTRPTTSSSTDISRIVLAYVTANGTSNLISANVVQMQGTASLPYITAPLQTVNMDSYLGELRANFESWWTEIQQSLSTGSGNYDTQIAALSNRVTSLESNSATTTQLNTLQNTLDSRIPAVPSDNAAWQKNQIFRGVSLGTTPTTEQFSAISAGTFNSMYLGDYWAMPTSAGKTEYWRIAGFDLFYGLGQDANNYVSAHHVVLVPDYGIKNSSNQYIVQKFHTVDDLSSVGLAGASIYTSADFLNKNHMSASIAAKILTFPDLRPASVSSNGEGSLNWENRTMSLLSEYNVFGSQQGSAGTYTNWRHAYQFQFPVFAARPELIGIIGGSGNKSLRYWLRTIVSTNRVAHVEATGLIGYTAPTGGPHRLRPFMLMGG